MGAPFVHFQRFVEALEGPAVVTRVKVSPTTYGGLQPVCWEEPEAMGKEVGVDNLPNSSASLEKSSKREGGPQGAL